MKDTIKEKCKMLISGVVVFILLTILGMCFRKDGPVFNLIESLLELIM